MEPFTGFAIFAAGVLLYSLKPDPPECAPSRADRLAKRAERKVETHVHIRIRSGDGRQLSGRSRSTVLGKSAQQTVRGIDTLSHNDR